MPTPWNVPEHADTAAQLDAALAAPGRAGAVLLGPDGVGKSTQCRLLADWAQARAIGSRLTFEPGDTAAGRMIRPGDLPTLPETVEALFFGGISLMVEPGGATYQALMEREAGREADGGSPEANVKPPHW